MFNAMFRPATMVSPKSKNPGPSTPNRRMIGPNSCEDDSVPSSNAAFLSMRYDMAMFYHGYPTMKLPWLHVKRTRNMCNKHVKNLTSNATDGGSVELKLPQVCMW